MKKYLLILFLFSLLQGVAQPPSKFINKFGGFGVDIGYGVKETFDRQYIVCGSTSSNGNNGSVDAQLLLVDSMGQLKWAKTYGGVLSDVAKSIVVNPADSGFIFAGHTSSFGNGGYDVYVVRTDKNGTVIWQKSFGGIDWDFGKDMVLSPDGNIIICGNSYSASYGKSDAYLLKVNITNGNLLWTKHYGGSEDDDFRSLKITGDNNNIILTGKTGSYNDAVGDIYFFKTDLNGDSVTHKTYGLKNKVDYGNEILDDAVLGGYIIGGGTESYSSGMKDAFIFKISLTNDSLWLRNYGKPDNDEETYKLLLSKTYQGRYFMTWGSMEFEFFKKDPKMILVESNGFYVYGGAIGEKEDEEFYSATNTSDKGFICVGYTKSYSSVLEDVYVMKYDSIIGITSSATVIGVSEQVSSSKPVKLYPTVIDDSDPNITIESESLNTLIISNLYSQQIKNIVIVESKYNHNKTISLKEYPPGLYFITVTLEGKQYQYKVIKR